MVFEKAEFKWEGTRDAHSTAGIFNMNNSRNNGGKTKFLYCLEN